MSYDPELYAALHRGTPGDLAFYAAACEGARSVLELGAGFGRVLNALSAPRLVGLELDPGLMALAPAHLTGPNVELLVGDMRRFELGEKFDRILIPFSGLYCLLSDAEVHACFEHVRRHLAPGGRLILDAWAADEMHQETRPEDHASDRLDLAGAITVRGLGYEVYERSTWDRDAQRMDVTYLYIPDEPGPNEEGTIRQRYLLRDQIESLLTGAGLETIGVYGDFDRRPFRFEDDLIVVEASAR